MRSLTDMISRTLTVAHAPQRIISLVPSQTELLYDMGLDNEVVGITKFCVHPTKWFREKDRVGGTKTIHWDKVQALQPDLIIANKEENLQADVEALEKHFPVWVSDVNTLPEACRMIQELGNLVNRKVPARQIAAGIEQGFAGLKNVASKSFAYFIWYDPWMVAGGDNFIHDLLTHMGWKNVFAHLSRYPVITLDEIVAAQPEVVMLSSEPYPFKATHALALQQHLPKARIQFVDGELHSWYGSRLLKSVEYFKSWKEAGHAWL